MSPFTLEAYMSPSFGVMRQILYCGNGARGLPRCAAGSVT